MGSSRGKFLALMARCKVKFPYLSIANMYYYSCNNINLISSQGSECKFEMKKNRILNYILNQTKYMEPESAGKLVCFPWAHLVANF
jgi:hypothetical protein